MGGLFDINDPEEREKFNFTNPEVLDPIGYIGLDRWCGESCSLYTSDAPFGEIRGFIGWDRYNDRPLLVLRGDTASFLNEDEYRPEGEPPRAILIHSGDVIDINSRGEFYRVQF